MTETGETPEDLRRLREDKIIETARNYHERIDKRFPGVGISKLAARLVHVCEAAAERAASICRPNWPLRAGLVAIGLLAVAGIIGYIANRDDQPFTLAKVYAFFDETKGFAAYLVAGAVFLWTLETRLKRKRALQAVHELRNLAHLVDMYQLTKAPDRPDVTVAGKLLDGDRLRWYLRYCTELLALLSKVGQLYVQDFPDATALAAVDQFENLTGSLSAKIYQKLMLLDHGAPATIPDVASAEK
jgi:hypothetical protein